MSDDRRRIALSLSKAAARLTPAERREFRKFLFSLDGAEPPQRKVHSWKRKKAGKAKRQPKPKRQRIDRQIPLPFD